MVSPTVIPFESATELLDYVSPLNPIWNSGSFIFRGQGSDEYKLTPSICRHGSGSFADGSPRKAFADTASRQIHFELEVLAQFLNGCDKSGLTVPGYTKEIKKQLANERSKFLSAFAPWPPPYMHEIMAVAQHYEVPTRLLDWTQRSIVACYFAASSANFEIGSSVTPRIAIWALDTSNADEWRAVSIIRTPGGTSKNQAAQSGLFTTHHVQAHNLDELYKPEALENVGEIYNAGNIGRSLLKLTLPVDQAPDLLIMCSKLGVEASTLFPGFHGVAKGVKDWANVQVGVRFSKEYIDEQRYQEWD